MTAARIRVITTASTRCAIVQQFSALRDYWQTAVVPALHRISLRDWRRDTGKSSIILIDARRGRRRPQANNRKLLIAYARKRGLLS